MKKLNRKGFTLVELLAVIIILAIVVGISIPAITSIINSSKNNALGVAVESAADYLRDQYDIYNLDASSAGDGFVDYVHTDPEGTENGDFTGLKENLTVGKTDNLFTEMGFDSTKVEEVVICVTDTGSVYVEVTKIPAGSDYFVSEYWTITDGIGTAKSSTELKNKIGNPCAQ